MGHSLQYLSFIFLTFLCVVLGSNPNGQCTNNPSFSDSNAFSKFFDQCFIDKSKTNILGMMSAQILMWFNSDTYPVYILVSLLVILFCAVKDSRGNDDMARYNFIRLQGLLLLMRVGLAISMTPWLWSAIQQGRPCFCPDGNGVLQPLNGITWWGMPSGFTFVSTVVAAHLMTTLSIPFGIVCTAIMGAVAIISGQSSFGQSIVGIVFGLVLHIYSIRTPLFLRIIDFFVSLVAGFIAIAIAMKNYPNNDFSFTIMFLAGLAWQAYAFTLLFVAFEWGFMRKALGQSLHSLHDVDFLYFRPLNSPTTSSSGSDSEPPPFHIEVTWTVFITSVIFLVLCGLRVLSPYLINVKIDY